MPAMLLRRAGWERGTGEALAARFSYALLLALFVPFATGTEEKADRWHCPSANLSIPEGSSGMIIPNKILNHSNSLPLYKKNHSSSSWQYILSIAKRHLNHSVGTYEADIYISDSGLSVKNAYEGLAGEYQLVYQQNESCVLQFFLNIPGSTHCPSRNVSIAEGSAGMIFANVSSYPYILLFLKSSSFDGPILAITEGELRVYNSSFKEHFYLQGNDLFIKNSSKQLAGEYQLEDFERKICFQVFLSIPVSGRRHDCAYGALGFVIFLVLCFAMHLCCKRREKGTAQLAGGLANGTLPPGSPEVQESRADPPGRENGNSFPHECDPQTNALLP
nr:uncharacterized protein LOC118081060 [Zootoca vivipara]